MTTNSSPPTQLTAAELKSVADTGPSVSGTPEGRFLQEALNYYRGWLGAHLDHIASNGVPIAQSLILLYSENPRATPGLPQNVIKTNARAWKEGFGLDNGLCVCTENLELMIRLIPSFSGIDEALTFCTTHLNRGQTFVIIPLVQRRMLVHQAGVDIEEWCNDPFEIRVETKLEEITPDSISDALDRFHSESMQKPGGHAARLMWVKDSPNPRLVSAAELHVQSILLLYFKGLYYHAGASVDEEHHVADGRVDLRIFRAIGKPIVRTTTMLELKVLYPDKSQDWNEKWGSKGIKQAKGYRNHDTDATFACLYDARRDKIEMPKLTAEATQDKVELRLFGMDLPTVSVKQSEANTKKSAKKSSSKSLVGKK